MFTEADIPEEFCPSHQMWNHYTVPGRDCEGPLGTKRCSFPNFPMVPTVRSGHEDAPSPRRFLLECWSYHSLISEEVLFLNSRELSPGKKKEMDLCNMFDSENPGLSPLFPEHSRGYKRRDVNMSSSGWNVGCVPETARGTLSCGCFGLDAQRSASFPLPSSVTCSQKIFAYSNLWKREERKHRQNVGGKNVAMIQRGEED